MSKRTRMLRNESEQMSEKISKDGRKVLEDMTLYISVYDQERVRRDITQMILDGEQRGDPASSVIGEDYKVFCDSVLEEIPRLTAGQKVMMTIRDMCGAMAVLSLLWGVISCFVCWVWRSEFGRTVLHDCYFRKIAAVSDHRGSRDMVCPYLLSQPI